MIFGINDVSVYSTLIVPALFVERRTETYNRSRDHMDQLCNDKEQTLKYVRILNSGLGPCEIGLVEGFRG